MYRNVSNSWIYFTHSKHHRILQGVKCQSHATLQVQNPCSTALYHLACIACSWNYRFNYFSTKTKSLAAINHFKRPPRSHLSCFLFWRLQENWFWTFRGRRITSHSWDAIELWIFGLFMINHWLKWTESEEESSGWFVHINKLSWFFQKSPVSQIEGQHCGVVSFL